MLLGSDGRWYSKQSAQESSVFLDYSRIHIQSPNIAIHCSFAMFFALTLFCIMIVYACQNFGFYLTLTLTNTHQTKDTMVPAASTSSFLPVAPPASLHIYSCRMKGTPETLTAFPLNPKKNTHCQRRMPCMLRLQEVSDSTAWKNSLGVFFSAKRHIVWDEIVWWSIPDKMNPTPSRLCRFVPKAVGVWYGRNEICKDQKTRFLSPANRIYAMAMEDVKTWRSQKHRKHCCTLHLCVGLM